MQYLLSIFTSDSYAFTRPLQTELDLQRIAKPPNGFSNAFRAGRGKRSAEKHLLFVDAISLEPAAPRNKDAIVDGSKEDLFFDGFTSLAGSKTRVLLPINLNPMLQCVSL